MAAGGTRQGMPELVKHTGFTQSCADDKNRTKHNDYLIAKAGKGLIHRENTAENQHTEQPKRHQIHRDLLCGEEDDGGNQQTYDNGGFHRARARMMGRSRRMTNEKIPGRVQARRTKAGKVFLTLHQCA